MAVLTVRTESALLKAGNYVLTASIFHGLAVNFGFCAFYASNRKSHYSPHIHVWLCSQPMRGAVSVYCDIIFLHTIRGLILFAFVFALILTIE